MKKKIYNILNYLFFLFIGAGLLWLVLKGQDLNVIFKELKNINYIWLIMSFVFAIISFINRSIRWNLLINAVNYKPKLIYTFASLMTGYFANLAIPRIGEITRCGSLSKKENIPFDLLLGTVIAERLFDLICLLLIIFFTIIFQFSFLYNFLNKYILIPFANNISNKIHANNILFILIVGLVVLFLLWIIWRKIYKFIKTSGSLNRFLKNILLGIQTIKKVKKPWLFIFHTIAMWVMYFFMTYICFFCFEETSHLRAIDGLTILVVGSLGVVAPTPGGIGTYHYFIKIALMEIFLINETGATAFPILVHASQMFIVILIGLLSFLFLFIHKSKKYDKIRINTQ